MVGGRPPKGDQQRHPELEELADWFNHAIEQAGYGSRNGVVRAELTNKNVVYAISNASRLLKLEIVKSYAVALGRDPAEVEPLWTRAKEAMERAAEAAREAKAPQLTAWTDLPRPSLSVKTLLEAQARAVERLPYDMLGVEEPPLSAVYVRQRVRTPRAGAPEAAARHGDEPRNAPSGAEQPPRVEARLPVHDAFARHEHLLITGVPGAGKSTLTSHLAWTLARIWLRQETSLSAPLTEPVLPVRVAAHSLVGDSASWSATLSRAVRRSMGSSLITDPVPWLFQGRAHGARWLILLDGLDEITDHSARRAVIRAIAQHARADGDYRFVITSRPLPEAELSPLRSAALGEYTLDAFGPEELREFAAKWFGTQFEDAETARAAADRFLKETEDSRLRELVRNPLLATIAAVNATVSPSRPLPTNRVSLYQSFFRRLLAQEPPGDPAGRSGVPQRLRDDEDRLALIRWLVRHKRAVLRTLGRHRLERKEPLLEAAVDWVREQVPDLTDRVPGWQDDLPDFLRGTGLLVSDQDGFRFLHHSFAEYFAAEGYAADIPQDFPDLEAWYWRAVRDDDQTLAVFVLSLWAHRADCEPDLLAEHLRTGTAGGHERPLLAGLLLAEGVRFGDAHCRLLIDQLVTLACCTWDTDHQDRAFDVLGGLGHVPGVAHRLERIARSAQMSAEPRLLAVRAFSRFGPSHVAEELLAGVLPDIYGWLDKAAGIASVMSQSIKETVRRRALEIVADPGVFPSASGAAVKALAQLGMTEDVSRTASSVLADHTIRAATVRQVTEAWLAAVPPETTHQVAETVLALLLARPVTDPSSHVAAGEVLEKFGEVQAAAQLARNLLASTPVWIQPVEWAATTLVKTYGEQARPDIVGALRRCAPDAGHGPWIPSRLHKALARLGGGDEAVAWAREMLDRRGWSLDYADDAAVVWLAVEGLAAVEPVMRFTGRGRLVVPHNRPELAQALFDAGAREEAEEIAELALRAPNNHQEGYESAARILVKTRGVLAAEQLLDIWRSTPLLALSSNWLRGVTTALPECEGEGSRLLPVLSELGRCLVALPAANGEGIAAGLKLLLAVEGTDAVPLVVRAVTRKSWLNWDESRELASECAALGSRDAALEMWRHILEHSHGIGGLDLDLLKDMGAAGATADAAAWIRQLLMEGTLHASRLLRMRRLLAWLEEGEHSASSASPATT
ncbi:hypothetical protein GCM10010129_63730 [Streptomyces fumigatiscleroticus]|nr:hypothetical protein GCM10010129_63730 [Streptomyces fumigatiscleroticus]